MRLFAVATAFAAFAAALPSTPAARTRAQAPPRPLRIIAFGAHPDDCELNTSGVAAKWAALGHKFKCVSVTNGDIGHWQIAGGPLAQRRRGESQRAARILGIETEVLDNHDGELMVTLENRRKIARLIREGNEQIAADAAARGEGPAPESPPADTPDTADQPEPADGPATRPD